MKQRSFQEYLKRIQHRAELLQEASERRKRFRDANPGKTELLAKFDEEEFERQKRWRSDTQ